MDVNSLLSNHRASPPRYTHLLSVIVLRLVVIPFGKGSLGEVVTSFLVFHITFLIIQSYQLRRSRFVLFMAIASIGFALDIILTLGWVSATLIPTLLVQIIYSFFFGSATLMILQRILNASRATTETVKGGICVYMLLGYVWALLYSIVYTLDPNAFSSALITEGSHLNVLYFSFITLTTLGFGDIVPVNEVASVLTILEALVGQIYPAVFMALLVSTYLAHRQLPNS